MMLFLRMIAASITHEGLAAAGGPPVVPGPAFQLLLFPAVSLGPRNGSFL